MAKKVTFLDDPQTEDYVAEVKVSDDGGQTWQRKKIDFGKDLNDSGLNPGEVFQMNGGKYEVVAGEDGLQAKRLGS
ncbi:Hypothetical protein DPCES_0866 [Desulfitobacterium hafniense]|uniref:Uncharacterized protein n=1 Tax=Desulfitobacterium hafniense TaxID=49338 RepID=A0A098AVY2_DESHA|nr:hypothetical protein [Desulfitobacterium hafniense]CDX00753.1 Hypothetical protein DPCES_0866 [Desulfitobacterium hafniense]